MKRALKTQFRYLFKADGLAFSGTILHQMLLRKSSSNEKEMKFVVNGEQACFDMKAYALITGLNFDRFPAVDIANGDEECPLVAKYFKGQTTFKIIDLESRFNECTDMEDTWKLGMICLVCQYLLALDIRRHLSIKIIGMTDDIHAFLQYPWGKVSFRATLKGLDKDIAHLRTIYMEKENERKKGKLDSSTVVPAYTLYGFALAFQVWTYEVIKTLVPQFAHRKTKEPNFPRITLYTSSRRNNIQEVVNAFKGNVVSLLEVSEEEKNLYVGEEFEEMGVSVFDQYIEVGKKRKNEDEEVVPTKRRKKPLTVPSTKPAPSKRKSPPPLPKSVKKMKIRTPPP